jgi:hypothetical protein
MWTGVGDLVWNSHTYKGVGEFGSVSTIQEGSEVQADGIKLTLSGVPTDLLNEGLNEVMQGKLAQVYLGFLDNNGTLIDPIPLFIGLIDEPEIDISTETAKITISVENRVSDLNRNRGNRYTDARQRARYPNDASLKYIHMLMDYKFNWY